MGLDRVPRAASSLFSGIKHREKKPQQFAYEALKPVLGAENVSSSLPWEAWELDEDFFQALSRWTLEHPETSLDRILEKMSNGITINQDLFVLIPDQPFPARSLVNGIAHLFTWGVTVSGATAEVYEFAQSILRWVINIKSAFDSTPSLFSQTIWKNLGQLRVLIDNICKWTAKRLTDGRLLRIRYGLANDGELSKFKLRMAEARKLFMEFTAIHLPIRVSTLVHEAAQRLEANIMTEIAEMKIFEAHHLEYIATELKNQKQVAEEHSFLSQTLTPHTVDNTTYSHQGKRPCDEGTRVTVLNEINRWIDDLGQESQNFLWLTGEPGCGKSAITAYIARGCKDKKVLWAQFFINRKDDKTTKPDSYFPSIAQQLANRSPDVQRNIYNTLVDQPSLIDGMGAKQATELFVKAIGVACDLDRDSPVVIVIDALDETDRNHLKETAAIFSQLFGALSEYPNAKIFISSRTEDDVTRPFSRTINDKHVQHIHLDTSAQSSIQDVATYLKRRLVQIVEDNSLDWVLWPGDERLQILVNRASGLFLWAVTAVKFLEQQIDDLGTECLDDVLGWLNGYDMDIYALYRLILSTVYSKPSYWEYEKFRRITGAIIVSQESLCLADLRALLNLHRPGTNVPVDILNFARRLRTVLVAGTDVINPKTVPRLHKSIYDFITSEHAALCFRIDQERARAKLAHQPLGPPSRLDSFRKYCSKWDSVDGWLDSNQVNLLSYISNRENLNASDKELCINWARNGSVYQRSTIYVYELLKLRADGQLAKLVDFMRTWSSWGVVEAISQHRTVSECLHALINRSETNIESINALDVDAICAHLYLVFYDYKQYQGLLDSPGAQSQTILDLLQAMLDSPSLDQKFRVQCFTYLLKTSKETGLYPQDLSKRCIPPERDHFVAIERPGHTFAWGGGHFETIGESGCTFVGELEGKCVAVKIKQFLRPKLSRNPKAVSCEALTWWQFRHTNILPLLNLYRFQDTWGRKWIGFVSPWMKNGNLSHYLPQNPSANRESLVRVFIQDFGMFQRFSQARDIAEGAKYLHDMKPTLVHGDLKATNILIMDTHKACLTDFAFSDIPKTPEFVDPYIEDDTIYKHPPMRWMAPELFMDSPATTTSTDVYAFACVLYEMFSGKPPFHEYKRDTSVILSVVKGRRPSRPTHFAPSGTPCEALGLDDHMWNIMEDCWRQNPTKRPTMSELIARLSERPALTI